MNKIIILTLLLLVKKICSKELICSHNMCTDYQIETKNGTYLINQEKDGYTIIFNNKILYKNCEKIYINDSIIDCRTTKLHKKTILSNEKINNINEKINNINDDIYIPTANVNTQNMYCNSTDCKILLDLEQIEIKLGDNSFTVLSSNETINENELMINDLIVKKEISICKNGCDYNIYDPQVINHYYKICIDKDIDGCDILIYIIKKNSNEQILFYNKGKMNIIQPDSKIKININRIKYELNGLLGFDNIKECLSASLINTINKIECYENYYRMLNDNFDYLDNKTIYEFRVINNTKEFVYYKMLENKKDLTVDKVIITDSNLDEIEYKIFNNNTLLLNYKCIISDKCLEKHPFLYKIVYDSNTTYNVLLVNTKEIIIILDDILKLEKVTIKNKTEKKFDWITSFNNTRFIIKPSIYFKDNYFRSNENCKIGINGQISEDLGANDCTLQNILPLLKQKYNKIQSNCDTTNITDTRNVCILNKKIPTVLSDIKSFFDFSLYSITKILNLIDPFFKIIRINIESDKLVKNTNLISFEEECKILQKVDETLICGVNYITKDNCTIYYNDEKKIC